MRRRRFIAGIGSVAVAWPFVANSQTPVFWIVFLGRPGARQITGFGGLATMASPFFNFNRKRLTALAAQDRLPSIWEAGAFVHDGGLLAYGPSFPDMYRRSAGYVARISEAQRPANFPSNSRSGSNWSSTSRPRSRSVSPCLQHCSPGLTKSSNSEGETAPFRPLSRGMCQSTSP